MNDLSCNSSPDLFRWNHDWPATRGEPRPRTIASTGPAPVERTTGEFGRHSVVPSTDVGSAEGECMMSLHGSSSVICSTGTGPVGTVEASPVHYLLTC